MSVAGTGSVKSRKGAALKKEEPTNGSPQNKSQSSHRKLTTSHLNQITVLRALSGTREDSKEIMQFQIGEITNLSGLDDEKEVQRYLFILEGQKLVTPHPEGDFTSRVWKITRDGQRALRTIDKSTLEN